MSGVTFRAELQLAGKTATGFEVPPDAVEALGKGKRPPVTVELNGYEYRSTVAPMRGKFMVGVSAKHREGAGVNAGEVYDVTLELDTEPREVELAPELAAAFKAEPLLCERFNALSFTRRRELAEPISEAKKPETRERRLDKALAALRG
jgi:hypothetical protein